MTGQEWGDVLRALINPADISALVCVLLGALIGIKKGFSEMFFNCIKNISILIISMNYLYVLTDAVADKMYLSYEATLCLVFTVTFIIFYIGITLLFFLLKKVIEIKLAEPLHAILGSVLGMFNASFLLAAGILFFTFIPSTYFIRYIYEDSFSGYSVAKSLIFIHNKVFYFFPDMHHFDGERFLSEVDARLNEDPSASGKES